MKFERIIEHENLFPRIVKIGCRFYANGITFLVKDVYIKSETKTFYKTALSETIRRDRLLIPDSSLINTTSSLGFYLYCLEEDIEKGLEIIKNKMFEAINKMECEIIKLKEKYEEVFCK